MKTFVMLLLTSLLVAVSFGLRAAGDKLLEEDLNIIQNESITKSDGNFKEDQVLVKQSEKPVTEKSLKEILATPAQESGKITIDGEISKSKINKEKNVKTEEPADSAVEEPSDKNYTNVIEHSRGG